MLFGIVEMLGSASVSRENQRDICPKHETFWGDSCHSQLFDVNLKYLFMQFMDGYNYSGEFVTFFLFALNKILATCRPRRISIRSRQECISTTFTKHT